MKINANSLRQGNVIEHKNALWVVVKIAHTKPGKGGAFIQTELRNIEDSTKLNERFRSNEDVERAHLDTTEYQFLYEDGDHLTFMDLVSFEQIQVRKDLVGEAAIFLQDGMHVQVISYEGNPIGVELAESVVLEVVETEMVVKGQTAASSNKPALLENGHRVMVPPFITTGDKLVIKTDDGSYVERAKV